MDHIQLLREFLSRDEMRLDLQRPFKEGEFICATNGHIAVIIPHNLITQSLDYGYCKYDLHKIIRDGLNHSRMQNFNPFKVNFSKLQEFDKVPIYKSEMTPCDECDGEGYTECIECGTEIPCKTCRGTGETEKEGDKEIIGEKIAENQLLKIRDSYFNPEYAVIIAKFFQEELDVVCGDSRIVWTLRDKDGIQILFMPMFMHEFPKDLKIIELETI